MSTVAQILQNKPTQAVHTVAPATSVLDAMREMAAHRIGALLIAQDGRIQGIVTERDYARKVEIRGLSAATTPIGDIMTADVMFVTPATTTQECMALMTDKRLRHLPVMDDGRLVGLVSIGDLVKEIISEQQFMIEQLESYIRS
ncbi:MAG: hypothetical protein RL456_25 [Pseudomonadota bacterium]|jgi:CBS domain-containing protein